MLLLMRAFRIYGEGGVSIALIRLPAESSSTDPAASFLSISLHTSAPIEGLSTSYRGSLNHLINVKH
jgi:hypothetical protein